MPSRTYGITITKKSITEEISNKLDMHPTDIHLVLNSFFESVTEGLLKGNRCEFRNFGVFSAPIRKAKIGRNPKDPKKPIPIPARNVVKFRAGRKLRKLIESSGEAKGG